MTPEEYRALRDWLRTTDNPRGFQAQEARRKLKAYERERGVPSEPERQPRTLSRGWVAYWPDSPGQPREGKVIHADQFCSHAPASAYMREATADELRDLPPCGICG